jgi:DNA-binding XRE family transcriptional regulator
MKNRIAEFRKAKNMTQPKLAEKAKISTYTALQKYEKGVNIPLVDTAIRIAQALDTTVEELFQLEDSQE